MGSQVVTGSGSVKSSLVGVTPATALPGSPSNGQLAILTDSLTAPTYNWTLMYDTGISGSSKWRFIGGSPAVVTSISSGNTDFTVPVAGVYDALGDVVTAGLGSGSSAVFTATLEAPSASVVRTLREYIPGTADDERATLSGRIRTPALTASQVIRLDMSTTPAGESQSLTVWPHLLG